ncbi:MAG: hypothetical protein F7O42_05205 [Opitutae bacterium]|nr:hypothetical protein [Opitutae bacterium]
MIASIKRVYKVTTTREKVLLFLFLGGIAVVWLGSTVSRYRQSAQSLSHTRQHIGNALQILDAGEYIEAQLIEKTTQFDSDKTLSSTELVGRISEIIRPLELKYSINSPRSETGTLFTFHNIRLNVNKAEFEAVLRLSDNLKRLVPYVTLDRVIVTADRSDQNLLDAQFFISSVEMTAPSL